MKKRIGDLKGGRNVIPTGSYKLKVCDFRVVDANAGPLIIVDVMVVGPEHQKELFGQHTELAFSTAGVGLKPWLMAMGMSEDDSIELDNKGELERTLILHCKDSIIFAEVEKVRKGDYDNNIVDKPWSNVGPSQLGNEDYSTPGMSDIPY